jgi:hypothetical protein
MSAKLSHINVDFKLGVYLIRHSNDRLGLNAGKRRGGLLRAAEKNRSAKLIRNDPKGFEMSRAILIEEMEKERGELEVEKKWEMGLKVGGRHQSV